MTPSQSYSSSPLMASPIHWRWCLWGWLVVIETLMECGRATSSFSNISPLHLYSIANSRSTKATSSFCATSTATSNGNSVLVVDTDDNTKPVWSNVPLGAPDAILGIAQAFRECTSPNKVDLCVGAYRDELGKPWVLPSVVEAEQQFMAIDNKQYLPIEGDPDFVQKAILFAYGADMDLNSVAAVQSLSGTGACRIGGEFLANFWDGIRTIYIPTPTWGNHWKIFKECGLNTSPYRYYDRSINGLDFPGLTADLEQAPDRSIILLHACAHNPTGCDPTEEQWDEIAAILERKGHVAFFDSAYQGFASGDSERDAAPFRRMVQRRTIPVLLAQSFAKNFGLYGERCGTFSVVCQGVQEKENLLSQLRIIIRPMYSSPPRHGSGIVKTVLSDTSLTAQYYKECAQMAARIDRMRHALVAKLAEVGSTHDWRHIAKQIGMFAFSGMSTEMCEQLTQQYAIYLTMDGRISMAGLNDANLDYVARAIHAVTDGKSITQS